MGQISKTDHFVALATGLAAFLVVFSRADMETYNEAFNRAEQNDDWKKELTYEKNWTVLERVFDVDSEGRKYEHVFLDGNKDGSCDALVAVLKEGRDDERLEKGRQINGKILEPRIVDMWTDFDLARKEYNPIFDSVPRQEKRLLNKKSARRYQLSVRSINRLCAFCLALVASGMVYLNALPPKPQRRLVSKDGEYGELI